MNSAELWNNLGLCCFHASQYDMALGCFERAFRLADDASMADVWYNIGQIALGEALPGGCLHMAVTSASKKPVQHTTA